VDYILTVGGNDTLWGRDAEIFKTWDLKKEPWTDRGDLARAQTLQGCDPLPPTSDGGIGASGWVTLRSFSDFCRAIFFGPTSCPKKSIMRTAKFRKQRARAYRRVS
jgi:hypothetical protein